MLISEYTFLKNLISISNDSRLIVDGEIRTPSLLVRRASPATVDPLYVRMTTLRLDISRFSKETAVTNVKCSWKKDDCVQVKKSNRKNLQNIVLSRKRSVILQTHSFWALFIPSAIILKMVRITLFSILQILNALHLETTIILSISNLMKQKTSPSFVIFTCFQYIFFLRWSFISSRPKWKLFLKPMLTFSWEIKLIMNVFERPLENWKRNHEWKDLDLKDSICS